MTDSLREKLVNTCAPVAPLYLSETELDSYPYVVYDMTTDPVITKDGIAGYKGDTSIRIVGQDLEALDTIRAGIESAISLGMHDSFFGSNLTEITKECDNGIWTIELTYTLKQYADWAPTVEQNNE